MSIEYGVLIVTIESSQPYFGVWAGLSNTRVKGRG